MATMNPPSNVVRDLTRKRLLNLDLAKFQSPKSWRRIPEKQNESKGKDRWRVAIRQTQLYPGMRSRSGRWRVHTKLHRPTQEVLTGGLRLYGLDRGEFLVKLRVCPRATFPASGNARNRFREKRIGAGQTWMGSGYLPIDGYQNAGLGVVG